MFCHGVQGCITFSLGRPVVSSSKSERASLGVLLNNTARTKTDRPDRRTYVHGIGLFTALVLITIEFDSGKSKLQHCVKAETLGLENVCRAFIY